MEAIVAGNYELVGKVVGKAAREAAGVLSSHLGNWSKVESLPENNSPKMIFSFNHSFSAIVYNEKLLSCIHNRTKLRDTTRHNS